jgi:alpha-glucosidase (family GH31 glycosyl hydrolase)
VRETKCIPINNDFFGSWYDIDAVQVEEIVDEYRDRSLPLDVFVFDMDCKCCA